jgi:cystathionine beta-lyase/cystathionine gamma-synthase
MTTPRPEQARGFLPRTRPVVPPIHSSVTYFLDDQSYKDVQEGGLDEIWYGRFRNPTVDVAAAEVQRWEGGEAAFMTSSGMGAIATTLLSLLRSGDRVVAATQVYGDTRDLLVRDLPTWGFDVEQVDAADLAAWRAAVSAGPTRLLYVETLTNPQLELADLPALAALAHEHDALLVVDNTFTSPWCVQPLALGADVVVHSATKFLNGHSDVIGGAVVGGFDLVREVQRRVITLGTCLDPHAAYLLWRGMQTFDVRMRRATQTARSLAGRLADHPDVEAVRYPGLADDPSAPVASRVLRRDEDGALRAGAMVAFTLSGGDERALRAMRAMQVACEATSLGGVETLVSTPFNSSHFSLTADERRRARIDDGMIRMSVGLEPEQLLHDDVVAAIEASA